MDFKPTVIHTTRAVYAMNWYDISPGLIFIQSSLSLNKVQLGLVITIFYIGVGIFQIPAGFIASKFGNRNIAAIGIIGLGVSSLISGLSPDFFVLSASRFLAGCFSAMFFSPAIGLLRSATSDSNYNMQVNIFNGSFNIGAAVGIGAWNSIDLLMGWRVGFLIAGFLTVATGIFYFFSLLSVQEEKSPYSPGRNLLNVLKSRVVWILAVAGTASVISENVVGQFLVYYLEDGLNFSYAAASYSGSIFLVFGFVGGILGGLTINKFRSVKSFFVASISITSFLMISISFFHNLIVIYLISAVLGMFTVQGFSAIYVLVSRSMSHRSQTTSSLSVVNAAQEVPGSIWPYVFTLLVAGVGYGRSWDMLGLVSFGMMFIILIPFSAGKRDPEMNDTHMR